MINNEKNSIYNTNYNASKPEITVPNDVIEIWFCK